ncbi:MAG: hypothetical protein JWP01_1210 [Myxococcales bacterium]|nr:hypothetical protein [Myxococcales bacterium]
MSSRTTLLTASVIVVAHAAPALASDHIMKVGEVMLANSSGSTAVQFIELEDPGEPFPAPPYVVEIFGPAGGAPLITYSTTIGNAALTRYTLATAQAQTELGFVAQTTLTATLPTNGQACFTRMITPDRIHCFAWGTVTTVVAGSTMNAGASPGNGMSVQRVAGAYVVAAPTPGAVNSNGMPMVDGPVDAGTPDGMDARMPNPTTPPDDDDGCNVGAGPSWFALVGIAALLLVARRTTTRRRR